MRLVDELNSLVGGICYFNESLVNIEKVIEKVGKSRTPLEIVSFKNTALFDIDDYREDVLFRPIDREMWKNVWEYSNGKDWLEEDEIEELLFYFNNNLSYAFKVFIRIFGEPVRIGTLFFVRKGGNFKSIEEVVFMQSQFYLQNQDRPIKVFYL